MILKKDMELNKEKLLELYPEYDSIYGPYIRQDGRKYIILNNSTAHSRSKERKRTVSYPKALVESNRGIRLKENETVDHNDRDINNSRDNLVIRDKAEHSRLDAIRVKTSPVNCVECGVLFEPSIKQRSIQVGKGAPEPYGPFCSRSCTGKYGARVQNGGEKLNRKEIPKIYYYVDK